MERHGCLYTKEVEVDDYCVPTKYTSVDMKNEFFKNLADCFRDALSQRISKILKVLIQ